jgi:hypothetical protein
VTATDELRTTCAEVARRARSVRVQEDAIQAYAASLVGGRDISTPPVRLSGASRADQAAYWLTLDAINFGSGWFPTLRKDEGRSGYATVSAAWRAHWDSEGPLDVAALTRLTPADVAAILGQDPDHELMELFALSLGDLGARLLDGVGGDPLALIDAAGGSAVMLASELGGWPCFADRSPYEELSVGFLKRAQIVAADLQRAGVAAWRDGDRLTMFADNLVPHVLRLDGVLWFAPALVARIDAGELIEHGSPEEVEIRACALHAVEAIVLARPGELIAAEVDEILWERGQGARYKAVPRHRSRCTAY